jgi:hypothetical protein
MGGTSPCFVSVVCSTKYMSNAMKLEAERKKMQILELEKWTNCMTDGVQQEPVHRSEQRAIRTPVFGQQSEVSYCSAFLFE